MFPVAARSQASLKHQTHVSRWRDDNTGSREEIDVWDEREVRKSGMIFLSWHCEGHGRLIVSICFIAMRG